MGVFVESVGKKVEVLGPPDLPKECLTLPQDKFERSCISNSHDKAVALARKGGESHELSSVTLHNRNLPVPFARMRKTQKGRTNIAVFGDHNRAYYYWHQSIAEGEMKKGAVLLHFDTHDDMQVLQSKTPPTQKELDAAKTPEQRLAIFDRFADELLIPTFIAPAVHEGLFSEIYWVLPDWAPKNSEMGKHLWGESKVESHMKELDDLQKKGGKLPEGRVEWIRRQYMRWDAMLGLKRDFKIYYGKTKWSDGREGIYFSPVPPRSGECVGKVREIMVHKVYKEELPDFGSETRSVVVDMDQDWINNTGYETTGKLDPQLTLDEAKKVARGFVATLQDKNIRPSAMTIAASPEFTYTNQVDDTTAVLLEEILKRRIADNPEFIEGKPSFSENTFQLAVRLARFVKENREADPRLVASGMTVSAFNSESVGVARFTMDENKHEAHDGDHYSGMKRGYKNRTAPKKSALQLDLRDTERVDYQGFIRTCDEYGLSNLSAAVRYLQWMQSQENASPAEIRWSYELVLEMTQTIMKPNG